MNKRISIFILVLSGILLYFNSLFNGFIGDDFDQIVNNTRIQSVWNIPSFFSGSTYFREETGKAFGLYYRPMMQTAYSLIYAFAGPDPLYFHLVSILLHICIAVLFYLLLVNYSSSKKAFVVSFIFIVHPINSEAVLYIANFQDLLFVLFGLISIHLLKRSDNRFSDLSALFLILSLFSKETGIIFFFLSALYILFYKSRYWVKYFFPTLFSVLLYLFFRFIIAGESFNNIRFTPIGTASLDIRLMNITQVIFTFIRTLFIPINLEINQTWLITNVMSAEYSIAVLISLIFLFLIIRNLKKGKIQSLFVFWVISSILLHVHLIPLDSTYSDRWFYMTVMGILGLIAVIPKGKLELFRFLGMRRDFPSANWRIAMTLLVILLFSARTFVRTFDYRDGEALYKNDLKYSKGNYYLENSLAAIYIQDERFSEAKPLVEASIARYPYFGNLNNMATIYTSTGNLHEAERYFHRAINSGGDFTVHLNYANFLIFYKKDHKQARDFLVKAVNLYPQSKKLFTLLSLADYWSGNEKEAMEIIDGIINFQKDEKLEKLKSIMSRGGKINEDEIKLIIGYQ